MRALSVELTPTKAIQIKFKMGLKLNKQKILSIFHPCLLGWTFAYLATNIFRNYALGLFIWLPFVLGATSTLILSYNNRLPAKVFDD